MFGLITNVYYEINKTVKKEEGHLINLLLFDCYKADSCTSKLKIKLIREMGLCTVYSVH